MDNQENLTDNSLADGAHVTPADGAMAVDSSTLSLTELNKTLGKDFKDVPTALKALQDTQSYVGKKREDIASELRTQVQTQNVVSPELESKVRSLEDEVFYSKNPQYGEYRAVIAKMGASPSDVVDSPEFKTVFEKGKVADEVTRTKSVVASNGRVAQSNNAVQEAVKLANTTASQSQVAELLAGKIMQEMG